MTTPQRIGNLLPTPNSQRQTAHDDSTPGTKVKVSEHADWMKAIGAVPTLNPAVVGSIGIDEDRCPTCLMTGTFGLLIVPKPKADWDSWDERQAQIGRKPTINIHCPDSYHAAGNAEVLRRIRSLHAQKSRLADADLDLTIDDLDKRGASSRTLISIIPRMMPDAEVPAPMATLWGTVGNGKSRTLKIITAEWLRAGRRAQYWAQTADLLDWLRGGYDDDGFDNRFEMVASMDMLALDEFDKVRETPFAVEVLGRLIDRRAVMGARGQGLTMLAMNRSPAKLWEHVADRIHAGSEYPDGNIVIWVNDASARRAGL